MEIFGLRKNKVLSIREQVFLLKRLELLLKSGIALPDAVRLVEKSFPARLSSGDVSEALQSGRRLSEVLLDKRIVEKSIASCIAVGEQTGGLGESLKRSHLMLEKKMKFRSRLVTSLIYPCILLLVSFALVLVMLLFVVPKISDSMIRLHVELPVVTKIVIWISETLRNEYWVFVSAGLIIFLIGYYLAKHKRSFIYQNVLTKIPMLRDMIKERSAANALGTLSLLLAAGVPLSYALNLASESCGVVWKEIFSQAATGVSSGKNLGSFLGDRWCPLYARDLVVSGEKSGKLSHSLTVAADWMTEEADTKMAKMFAAFEPLLLCVLGVVIALVALSVIIPIYGYTSSITK